jgi:TolB-like protein
LEIEQLPEALRRKALESVLGGAAFKRSEQLRRLLEWLGEASLEHRLPSEYEVGVGALRRGPDFDPQSDSIVRREMCRLREKLGMYYAGEGRMDTIRVDCRSGYRVLFRRVDSQLAHQILSTPRLLILPLRATPETKTWASALYDEIFAFLANKQTIQLISQTTCLQFGERLGDIREFAAETGADTVLEGSIRSAKRGRVAGALWLVHGRTGLIEKQCLLSPGSRTNASRTVFDWLIGWLQNEKGLFQASGNAAW